MLLPLLLREHAPAFFYVDQVMGMVKSLCSRSGLLGDDAADSVEGVPTAGNKRNRWARLELIRVVWRRIGGFPNKKWHGRDDTSEAIGIGIV